MIRMDPEFIANSAGYSRGDDSTTLTPSEAAQRSSRTLMPPTEEELAIVAGLRARDPAALEQFYDSCRKRAFGLAFRILSDHGQAEETVQDSFYDLWIHADRLEPGRGRLVTLLLTIVHHKAIDRLRQRRGQPPVDLESISRDSLALTSKGAETAELSDAEDTVRDALSSLPAPQLETIQLAYFGGYTQVEISAKMNVSLGTVKSRMRLGLERLRLVMSQRATE